jgi:hypothetical protein
VFFKTPAKQQYVLKGSGPCKRNPTTLQYASCHNKKIGLFVSFFDFGVCGYFRLHDLAEGGLTRRPVKQHASLLGKHMKQTSFSNSFKQQNNVFNFLSRNANVASVGETFQISFVGNFVFDLVHGKIHSNRN